MAVPARPPGADPSPTFLGPTVVYRRLIQFSDTDMAGICHFANFFRLMEEAEHHYLSQCGLSVFPQANEALTWPRVSAHCDYVSPARFEDVLAIEVGVTKLGGKSATYGMNMRLDDRLVAHGHLVAVCCRVKDGHLVGAVPIPDDLRDQLLTPTQSAE